MSLVHDVRSVRLQPDLIGPSPCALMVMITRRPEHLKGFNYLGLHRYFLTFCTYQRRRSFADPDRVSVVQQQMLRTADEQRFVVLAYCFMPDHVHLLIEGRSDDADCRRFITRAKQFSGFYYKKQFGEPLWQRYGFERTLRNTESTLDVARYIVANPLRAGLVARVEEYPFIGSGVYAVTELVESIGSG